jgi:copper homeostasis protein CutC
VLTSGQEASAICGIQLTHLLVIKAEGRIGILPAGGMSESNAAQVLRRTGVTELHGSVHSMLKESVHVLPGGQNTIVWTVTLSKFKRLCLLVTLLLQ